MVQLQKDIAAIEATGTQVVGVSYDSTEVLRNFAEPAGISFPLLSDDGSKTIWGRRQIAWFKRTVAESDATFRILISPTPLVGPDRESKNDNHANRGFRREGDMLREFIGRQKNMVVLCGDRHWQYVSVDPKTGVREYSCGPTSDKHAGGFSESKRSSMHRYLKIKGGFLSVTVERTGGRPTATFRHHAVDGSIYNEDRLVAKE